MGAETLASSAVAIVATAGVAWLASLLLVLTQRWHGRFTHDSFDGAQKFHFDPTPRVGGVAVVAAVAAGTAFLQEPLLAMLLLASLPAFLVGLLEDITKRIGVGPRLWATVVSGVGFCLLAGVHLQSVHVPLVDDLLVYGWFAIPFTAFAIAGVANSVNIVDGFNGLAGGVAVILLAAIGVLAMGQEDAQLGIAALVTGAAVAGFLIVNFPFGKIFLGDGGAYFVGFAVAVLAVLAVARNADVSPWALMLICAYPVTEMLFSCWRRIRRKGHHPSDADRLHLHTLLYHRVCRKRFSAWSPALVNGMTAPFCWLLAAMPAGAALLLAESDLGAVLAFFAFALGYVLLYRRLTRFRWFRSGRGPGAGNLPEDFTGGQSKVKSS